MCCNNTRCVPVCCCSRHCHCPSSCSDSSNNNQCCEELSSELEEIIDRLKELEKNQCHCNCKDDDEPTPDEDDESIPGHMEITLLGGPAIDRFYGLIATEDGYVACGNTASTGAGGTDALLVKYSKDLGVINRTVVGGTADDCFASLVPTATGGYLVFGDTLSAGTTGGVDGWVFGTDKNMAMTSSSLLGSTWHEYFCYADTTPAGFTGSARYVAVGYTYTGSVYAGFISTYDKDANVLKTSRVGSTTSGVTHLRGVVAVDDGFVAVGYTNNPGTAGLHDGLIIKYDPVLNVQKKILIGGVKDDGLVRIAKTATGYVVGGYTASAGKGGNDILMLTLDEDLKVVSKVTIGGTGGEGISDLAVMPNGNFVITGSTSSAGAGSYDVLLMVVDKDLNILKQLVFGGSGEETSSAVVANSNGSFTVAGYTASVGAGSMDTFIATFKGNFADLTGNCVKYPTMRINAGPGLVADKSFNLTVNDSNSVLVSEVVFSVKTNPARTLTVNPAILQVDAGAV